jgi:hypothetical protein
MSFGIVPRRDLLTRRKIWALIAAVDLSLQIAQTHGKPRSAPKETGAANP